MVVPAPFVTDSDTVKFPVEAYRWIGLWMVDVIASPKFHEYPVIPAPESVVFVDWSVKFTSRGTDPDVGVP